MSRSHDALLALWRGETADKTKIKIPATENPDRVRENKRELRVKEQLYAFMESE